jgi:hypothetical protein
MAELDRTVVCFFCDELFASMVVPAITTLLQATPRISVGLLTQSRSLEGLSLLRGRAKKKKKVSLT